MMRGMIRAPTHMLGQRLAVVENAVADLVKRVERILYVADNVLPDRHVLNLVYEPHNRFERISAALHVLKRTPPQERVKFPVCERIMLCGVDMWGQAGYSEKSEELVCEGGEDGGKVERSEAGNCSRRRG